MNNPLAQKYNYYLNESYRLSEELKSEQEYSELLESILVDLLNNEQLDEGIKKKLGAALLAAGVGAGLGAAAGAGAASAPHALTPTPTKMSDKIEAAKKHGAAAVTGLATGAGLGAATGAGTAAARMKRRKK